MTTAAHTRILGQLMDGHAAMNAAGLGTPELDAFNESLMRIVSESDDPQGTLRRIVQLLEEDMAARASEVHP